MKQKTKTPSMVLNDLQSEARYTREQVYTRCVTLAKSLNETAKSLLDDPDNPFVNGLGIVQSEGYMIDVLASKLATLQKAIEALKAANIKVGPVLHGRL